MSNKTVLVTGATGLVGTELVKQFHDLGYTVHYLTTSKSKIENKSNYKGFYWDLNAEIIDANCLEGVSVIIHLAGASIAQRWTTAYKEKIVKSRVDTVALLRKVLDETPHNVTHVVAASAVGIYEDSLTIEHTENSNALNSGFLAEVVKLWETATASLSTHSINVTQIRIGIVLSKKGGAFVKMSTPIKWGLGAPFGSGKQWQSWIHLEDLAGIFIHVVTHKLYGVYNAVAPTPITIKALTKKIAKHYNKPNFLPGIPKFVMQLVLGEMHTILYESQKVSNNKIEKTGFQYQFPTVDSFLSVK